MSRIHNSILQYFSLLERSFKFIRNSRHFHKSPIFYKEVNPNQASKKLLGKKVILFEELQTDEEFEKIQNHQKILEEKIKSQGDVVRELKVSKTSSSTDIKDAIEILLQHKKELQNLSESSVLPFDKTRMDYLIKSRFYYDSAFQAYGGVSGQYDYGPTGSSLLDNILSEWKKHFILRHGIMMMNGSVITPEAVFKSSGHLDRFTDYVVKDSTGELFRLDHFIKERLEEQLNESHLSEMQQSDLKKDLDQIDNMGLDDLMLLLKKYDMKSPNTQKEFEDVSELNLMFPISLSSGMKNYLKPEHAQGIILNFKKLLEMNDGKLPLACAQIGLAFRNEFNVRQKLLRVREFVLAEIEHFCYSDDKSHPKFAQISDTKLWLFPACRVKDGLRPLFMSIGEAVTSGVVGSETLGFYMAQTQRFLMKIGMEPLRVRFRQHSSNHMAHYATDCWDAEVLTSYGWVECAGCADRGTFDISQHSKATDRDMSVERNMKEPCEKEVVTLTLDKNKFEESFGEDADEMIRLLNDLSPEEMLNMNEKFNTMNGEYTINGVKFTKEMVPQIEKEKKMISIERVTPCVIEPSFGIGRIFYCLLEHTFRIRDGNEFRPYFALPAYIAPFKVAVLPLFKNVLVERIVQRLVEELTEEDVSVWIDKSRKSIGRRYVKMDELSVPFCVTIDEETLKSSPQTVTLRDRDSTKQIRLPMSEVLPTFKQVAKGKLTWKDILEKWPIFTSKVER